jgi:hypothetical protein
MTDNYGRHVYGRHVVKTDFPAVRRVMGPDRSRLDDADIEELLEELFPGAEPEDVEDFMRSVQQFGRQAAPLAQKALPGVMQGAQAGMVAGPWGALVGGIGGGALSLLGPSGAGKAPRPAAAGPPAAGPPPAAPVPPPAGPAMLPPLAPTAAAPASAQLLTLLSRPETMQALLAMLLAGSGRNAVQVGQQQVPTPAFANAIAEVAAAAGEMAGATVEGESDYLFDAEGHPRGDLVNPTERAAVLLADLAEVAAAEAEDEALVASDEARPATWPRPALGEPGDPMDSYEAALRGGG